MHRTGVEPMSTAWKAACYATTTPTMLRRLTIEEINLLIFVFCFSLQIFWGSHKKKLISEKRSSFFANQTNFFLINRKLSFLVCYFSRTLGIQRETRIYYFMNFFPSNAHNSNVQTFPKTTHSFTGRLILCIVRESKPCQQLGRLCYHYTNDAEKVYDQRDQFQNFQTWLFHYTFSECHIKKKPKLFFEKRSNFFANQTILFSLIESCCCFWFVTSQGLWEFKKRQEFTISW